MKYKIINDAGIEYDCDSLGELVSLSEELKTRRTGRTTRMFLHALGSAGKNYLFVGFSPKHTGQLYSRFVSILKQLEFPFTEHTADREVRCYGRTYYFHHDSNYLHQIQVSGTAYKDEK